MFVLPHSISHENALSVRQAGLSALDLLASEERVVSAQDLKVFDSTALAVMLAFQRAYPELVIVHASAKLSSLSKVYGLDTILTFH